MEKSQVITGDILAGGHKVVIVGLNCRDNCGSAAIAVARSMGCSILRVKHLAQTGRVGEFVKMNFGALGKDRREVLGLVLRRDTSQPLREEDLRSSLGQVVRYLGSRSDLRTGDVGMVAIGTGTGQLAGGFGALLRLLAEAGYPGLVYQPLDPGARLEAEAMERLGLRGRLGDAPPAWCCAPGEWTEEDERRAIGVWRYGESGGRPVAVYSPTR